MNSSKHLAGVKVGRAGYNRGCRCAACSTAQREYKRQYRSRTATVAAVPGPYVVGPMEAAVQARIDEFLTEPDDAGVLIVSALMDARLLDVLAAKQSAVGVAGLKASMFNALDRLAVVPGESTDGGEFSTKAKRDAWAADLL